MFFPLIDAGFSLWTLRSCPFPWTHLTPSHWCHVNLSLELPQTIPLSHPLWSCRSPFFFHILLEMLVSVYYRTGFQVLIYVNDLALVFPGGHLQFLMKFCLTLLQNHCCALGLKMNPDKSKFMVFCLLLPERLLSWNGLLASVAVKRHFYIVAIISTTDYCAHVCRAYLRHP